MRLDTRLDKLEQKFEAIDGRRGHHERMRALETWARKLHPAEFEHFEKFLGDFAAKHPGLSWRETLIELGKDRLALQLERRRTDLIVEQFGDRRELQ